MTEIKVRKSVSLLTKPIEHFPLLHKKISEPHSSIFLCSFHARGSSTLGQLTGLFMGI